MKKHIKYFSIFYYFLYSFFSFGQNHKLDSLRQLLSIANEDTNKVIILQKFAYNYFDFSLDTCAYYSELGISLAKKLMYKKGEANLLDNLGYVDMAKGNYETAMNNHLQALNLHRECGDKYGEAYSLNGIGYIYDSQGNFDKALGYYLQGLGVMKGINSVIGIGKEEHLVAIVEIEKGNYKKGLEYILKNFSYYKSVDRLGDGYKYLSIGYQGENNWDSALYYAELSQKSFKQKNDLGQYADVTNEIAKIYLKQEKYKDAITMAEQSLTIGNKIKIRAIVQNAEEILAQCYEKINDYKNAYKYHILYSQTKDSLSTGVQVSQLESKYQREQAEILHQKEIELQTQKERTTKIISVLVAAFLIVVAIFLFLRYRAKQKQNKNLEESFRNIEVISKMGVKMTSTLNLSEAINVIYEYLNNVMDAKGFSIYIYNTTNENLELKYALDDYKYVNKESISLNSEDSFAVWCVKNKKEVFINDVKTEYSKFLKDYYWSSVDTSEEEGVKSFINVPLSIKGEIVGVVSVHSFKKNAYTKYHNEIFKSLSSYIAVALNNAEAYSHLNSAKLDLAEQKKIIEEKNKDITDSINYAKRIQHARLASQQEIYNHLPNSFILFKPKDIVSGDFYYFHKQNNSILIASADCTGHGVPGAFMSMICSEKLDDVVSLTLNPPEILYHLNNRIKTSLHQSDNMNSTKDGMEIALCSIETEKNIVKFSGANRPIWIVRNGKNEIEEIKTSKNGIGGFTEYNQSFPSQEIVLSDGDTFYIFSDGFADTFSREGKKLTTKKFKEILLSIQNKSMQEQEKYLDDFIESWKAGTEQVDDILVIGVKM